MTTTLPSGVPGPATVRAASIPLPRTLVTRDTDRMRRYREYLDYHEGRRGGPPRSGRDRVHTFNYARAIVEKGASYLVTDHRPLVHPLTNGVEARREAVAAEALLREVWDANDLARLDIETEIDTATLGDGAFKVTWDEHERRVIVSAPDVQGLYVWWHGDDVRRVARVAARYEMAAESLAEQTGRAPRAIGGVRPRPSKWWRCGRRPASTSGCRTS